MLVGREPELRELLGAMAAAVEDGRGFTALIGGEPGIGKTRLAGECAARLRAGGVTVAWAACRQDGGAPPYWPWAQLLRRLGHPGVLAAPAQAEPEFARFLLFEAVADVLRSAAPVVLVLDDLHWADQPSLLLLDALGAHVGAASVIVLGTYRDTEPGAVGSVAALTAERRIVLRGLPADELGPALSEDTGESISPAV
ncbi:MAG: ATP-binding protein, partial [Pseudonocardia sp.]|nr:ATP-binding protein [Pseudonocardia sp.]